MKLALIVLVVVIGLLIVVEIALRLLFGFGNPLIYVADPQIGYLLAPNQNVRRFGKRVEINQYSMRSPAILPERPAESTRVLLLGDSVANGGWWTDQSDTISEMLKRQLEATRQYWHSRTSQESSGEEKNSPSSPISMIEVLNASANSWGPRNELAYLKRFGNFHAQTIVLLLNMDDLFGAAPNSSGVGIDRNYPDRKPPLALWELISRYVLPVPSLPPVKKEAGDLVSINLAAIEQVKAIAQQTKSQFLLAMTPLLREIGEPGSRDYERKARQRLSDFVQAQQIHYIDFLPIFKAESHPTGLYRDHIHLSPAGNRVVSAKISQALKKELLEMGQNRR
ncbi:MAG: SGNH/GDSL hydrolase family protein [Scytolyngbya sp. HA4215-MV1]|nr:SGNH/GDSL hydrolase family protein [Scytolyngbya sp. HA4215-MV1]